MANSFFFYLAKCAEGITNSKANRKEFAMNLEQRAHELKLIMCIKTSSLKIRKNYFEKMWWGPGHPRRPRRRWPMLIHIGHAIVKILFACERNLIIKTIGDNVTVLGYLVNVPQQAMKVTDFIWLSRHIFLLKSSMIDSIMPLKKQPTELFYK